MRSSDPGGRFSLTHYEPASILDGIDSDLRSPVGQWATWWTWDSEGTDVDPIYDTGQWEGGRKWKDPIRIPTYGAFLAQGMTVQNDRGFYQTDLLRVSLSVANVRRLIPSLLTSPDQHHRDRIVYRDEVFIPTRIYLRGLVRQQYTVVSVDANQVNPEELINDPQFQEYSSTGGFEGLRPGYWTKPSTTTEPGSPP